MHPYLVPNVPLNPLIQGDGNIRYYELSTEKPYISFLTEYRSLLPQKGLGEINTLYGGCQNSS